MAYRTLYDLHEQPAFSTTWALICLSIILLGIGLRYREKARDERFEDPPKRVGITTPVVLILFGSLAAIVGIVLVGFDHWRLVRAWDAGEAGVVEGPVQSWGTERVRTGDHKKQEYHTYERFYIGDSIWFGYRWEVGQAGFHNALDPQVRLKDGMMLRATYLYADGKEQPPRIVKLEVADRPWP